MYLSPVRLKGLLTGALVIGAVAAYAFPAAAQTPVSFATFFQDPAGPLNPFTFVNNGAASTFSTVPPNIPVRFQYLVPNSSGTLATIDATLNLTSTVGGPATPFAGFIFQPLQTVNFSFIGTTGAFAGKNLLTATSSTGQIIGQTGTSTGNFTGALSGGDIVNFTSDFIDFTGSTARDFSFGLNAVNPVFAMQGSYLRGFQATGSGNFAAAFANPVPEPGAVVGMGMLGAGLCGLMVRARRRTARKPQTLAAA